MKLKPIFTCQLLLFICAVPRYAQCQAVDGVYRGTLGKQEIVLEIGADPERKGGKYLVGRYFCRRYGIDISIKGTRIQDGSVMLGEDTADETPSVQWRLKFQDNAASGSFCKCDLQKGAAAQAKTLPIYLERVSSDFDADFDGPIGESTHAHQAYYDLLLDFPLTAGPDVAIKDGYAYSMMTDSRFKTSMPRISKFPDARAMIKINTLLQKELGRFRLEASHCFRDSGMGGFDISTSVALFSRHLLTVLREGDYYCGGAHPDNYFRANTYDLDYGTEVSAQSLLAREMDPAAVQKAIKDSEAAGEEAISRLAAELYLQHATPEDECWEVINRETTDASSFTIYLSESGLVITPALPHVVAACADPVLIRYDELRPLLKKNSQFRALVETVRTH